MRKYDGKEDSREIKFDMFIVDQSLVSDDVVSIMDTVSRTYMYKFI